MKTPTRVTRKREQIDQKAKIPKDLAEPDLGWDAAASRATPAWKRWLDLSIVALSLPLLVPVLVVVSIWIKATSKGALLFIQERVGHRGRCFTIYKFRSMVQGAPTHHHESHVKDLVESGRPMTKLDLVGDGRLVPGGKFLRKTGLDELPQLFNVIRGEMSLVGPRPCLPKEYELYSPSQRERFEVVPGLTGYWQVRGKNRRTFTEMIALDVHYARNRSLWLDLKIIARTPWALLMEVLDSKTQAEDTPTETIVPDRRKSTLPSK